MHEMHCELEEERELQGQAREVKVHRGDRHWRLSMHAGRLPRS